MKDLNRKIILNKLGLSQEGLVDSNEKKPLIEINDLSVNFSRGGKLFEAVKSANLKIYENDIVGIVGESGSGKTTLGRATISLWDHAKGEVKIDGRTLPNKRIKSVSDKNVWVYEAGQMIFQDPTSSLNRQQKVLDIVSEGIKNFKTVEYESLKKVEELDKEIKNISDKIKYIEDEKFRNEFATKEAKNEEFSKLIANSKNKDFDTYVNDYAEYTELNEKLSSLKEELDKTKLNTKNELDILKKKIKSEKLIVKEENENDWEFFKNAIEEAEDELKKISERNNKNPERVKAGIEKRLSHYVKYINKKSNKIDGKILNEIGFKDANVEPSKNKESIASMEKWLENKKAKTKAISDKEEISKKEQAILDEYRPLIAQVASLCEAVKLIEVKNDELISIYNTRAFDFLYEFIDDKIADRINYLRNLVDDLDKRLILEEDKWNNHLKDNEDDPLNKEKEDSYNKAISYLEEYRAYLVSLVIEYRVLRVKYKEWLSDSIKTFSKKIKESNNKFELLAVSLTTWKGEQRKDYIERNSAIKIKELERKVSELEISINDISTKYNDIEDILGNVKETLSKEIEKINSIQVTKDVTNEEKDQIKQLTSNMNNLILKKDTYEALTKQGGLLDDEIKRRVIEILKIVGLNEEAINKFPDQFSGGQKQRIGIARTLISNPKLIIADEPISALDVSVQAQVINLLKELHEKLGLTMMFIAHDLEMVHYISTKIVVIYRGNIVEYGDADKVYKSPKHPYTQSLIAAMPSLKVIGKKLEVSEYKWSDHAYNEFSGPKLHQIEEDHFVFGTEKEIKEWTKK